MGDDSLEAFSQVDQSLHGLGEVDNILDEIFGKQVITKDDFPDEEKFIKSVIQLQRSGIRPPE